MKKRLGALLCALVMCLALLSPASALEEVCFTSLNNKLLPLASDTMPLWSGGVLYVPASLFDGSATNSSYGVTLGVSLTQSQSSGTITLYSLSGILVFDLNSGICVDQQTGELLSGRAITRNGRIYLPLNIVVDFFGLRSSYLHTDYGYLVRIKNRDDTASNGRRSILTDEVFIDSAGNQMNLQLKEYQKSLLPAFSSARAPSGVPAWTRMPTLCPVPSRRRTMSPWTESSSGAKKKTPDFPDFSKVVRMLSNASPVWQRKAR